MYVSTAYSNAHLKRYSTVKEQLYPLREPSGQEVDHAAIVNRLLAMPIEEAQSEVSAHAAADTHLLQCSTEKLHHYVKTCVTHADALMNVVC